MCHFRILLQRYFITFLTVDFGVFFFAVVFLVDNAKASASDL